MAGRVTQVIVEVGADGSPTGRVTQIIEEIGAWNSGAHSRVTQVVLELGAWDAGAARARATQFVSEAGAWNAPNSFARSTQVIVEVLVYNHVVDMPLTYPDKTVLPGLGYSVIWRTKAVNAPVQTAASGAEVRVSRSQYPLHEFELTYDVLRDLPQLERKTFQAFFAQLGGSLSGFLFKNTDDYSVVGQSFVTTDGINSQFGPLVRTYGASGYSWTEPVGYVDATQPFRLYMDGAVVDPNDPVSGYSLLQTQPCLQMIKFNNTPGAGHVLTVDMSYFYYCRFDADSMDFEKFMNGLWLVKQVKLLSLRM